MRRASRLYLQCRSASRAHPGVRPPVCAGCCLALAHAALELAAIRSILGYSERRPRGNTSGRWFPAFALELAGVPSLDRLAVLADCSRAGNFFGLSRPDIAFAARLVETLDRCFAAGSGRARGLLHAWGP